VISQAENKVPADVVRRSWLIAKPYSLGRTEASLSDDAIDWMATVHSAGEDFAVPALATVLKDANLFQHAPPDVQQFLNYALTQNARMNERIREQCLEIGTALAQTGVSCALLKGATWLFEDGAARQDRMLRDIDVLVPHAATEAAWTALVAQGYAPSPTIVGEPGHIHELPLEHAERPVTVELHVELTTWVNYLDPEQVLAQSRAVAPGVSMPCPLHRIVHNVVHAQLSNGDYAGGALSLRDSLDLGRLLQKSISAEQWFALTSEAHKKGYFGTLSGALHKAAYVTGAALPDPFASDDAGPRHLRRCLLQRRWPAFDRTMRKYGVFRRATAWERDAYALQLGDDRSLRAHWLVNRRRLQRMRSALYRNFGFGHGTAAT
jgi:hypothetical protein